MPTTPYVTQAELARVLKIRSPSTEQQADMDRVLMAAAVEIDKYLAITADDEPLTDEELDLAAEVNLERAVEHWETRPFGVVGLGADLGGFTTSRTWERHAEKLVAIRRNWGFA